MGGAGGFRASAPSPPAPAPAQLAFLRQGGQKLAGWAVGWGPSTWPSPGFCFPHSHQPPWKPDSHFLGSEVSLYSSGRDLSLLTGQLSLLHPLSNPPAIPGSRGDAGSGTLRGGPLRGNRLTLQPLPASTSLLCDLRQVTQLSEFWFLYSYMGQ